MFEALDLAEGVKCAVKVLHPEHTTDAQVIERLYAEVQAASRISHPNIVRYGTFSQTAEGVPFIVMELLVGVPLSRYLGTGRTYEVPQVLPILRGVLSGLGAAHSRRIVHRDLKPENIFLARGAHGSPVPKLLDFGIAKIMDAAGGGTSRTKTGVLLGTPGYMSPEQIRSPKDVDPRTDLWAAAVVLYELLCGSLPFPGATEMAKLSAIVAQEPVPVDYAKPQLVAWREFFGRALAKDPRYRFGSAEEMALAMDTVGSGPSRMVTDQGYPVRPSPVPGRGHLASIPPPQAYDPSGPRHASIPPTLGHDGVRPHLPSLPPVPAIDPGASRVVVAGSPGPGQDLEVHHLQQTLPSADARLVPSPQGGIGRYSVPYLQTNAAHPASHAHQSSGSGAFARPRPSSAPTEALRPVAPLQSAGAETVGVPVWIAGLGVAVAFLVGLALGLLLAHR